MQRLISDEEVGVAEAREGPRTELRSYLETIACLDLIERRAYLRPEQLIDLRHQGHQLFIKLSASHNTFR